MDAFGHVNNTQFFRWFESARIAYFEAVGLDAAAGPTGVAPILASTTCDFLAQVAYPATVVCRAGVSRVGNTSFVMDYVVHRGETLVARGSGVIVTLDYAAGSKVRVPDAVRARIAALQDH
jgi:acyl-CoA thioester hydrolase